MDKPPLLFTKAFRLLSIGTSFGTDLSLLRAVSTLSELQQPNECLSTGPLVIVRQFKTPL